MKQPPGIRKTFTRSGEWKKKPIIDDEIDEKKILNKFYIGFTGVIVLFLITVYMGYSAVANAQPSCNTTITDDEDYLVSDERAVFMILHEHGVDVSDEDID